MILKTGLRCVAVAFAGWVVAAPALAHGEQEHIQAMAAFFKQATVVAGPTAVDCTLSGGTKTRCFAITVKPQPGSYTPGPWCPTQASDGPDKSGIWLKDGQVLDADGAFMGQLPQLYEDPNWQMVDPQTGKIKVTDTREACDAAARPDVDPKYRNYCVQCLPEYLESDHQTYVIPLEPQAPGRTSDVRMGGAGQGCRSAETCWNRRFYRDHANGADRGRQSCDKDRNNHHDGLQGFSIHRSLS